MESSSSERKAVQVREIIDAAGRHASYVNNVYG
jgi:hypothetical protein